MNRRTCLASIAAACFAPRLPSFAAARDAASPRPIEALAAPTNLGLRPLRPGHVPGAAKAPAALIAHGLLRRLGAIDGGSVPAPAYAPDVDRATGYRNGANLARYTPLLATRIGAVLDRGHFALVIGGDCSVLAASALALKRRGRHGLLFVDGHSDFYFPRAARALTAAGMDLALATGHGPDAIANVEQRRPYVREDDAVVFGYRDYGTPDVVETERFERAAFARMPLDALRAGGWDGALRDAIARLEKPALDGFWIHVDVDVLDPAIMPAVDSPDPGGMTVDELERTLAAALASPKAVGLELTIYDPDLDPDGRYAETLVALLGRAFARAGFATSDAR